MGNQKFFWKENLRFLRERDHLTQDQLAEKLGITRSKLKAHESGQTKNPPLADLDACSEYFKMSVDTLMKIDLRKIGELKIRELQSGNDVYIRGGNLRVVAITVDASNKENVEYVPVKAKAGYLSGYNDEKFIAGLPKYSLPNLPAAGTYRIFPISGDSMLPIPSGSDVVARYVQDWPGLKADTLVVAILNGNQDFVFKRMTVQQDGIVLFTSLNPAFAPFEVSVEHVREVWKFHSFISTQIPALETDMAHLTRMVTEIKTLLIKPR